MFQVVSGLSSLNLTSSSNNSSSSANSSSSSNNSTFFKSVFLEKLDDKDIIESTPVEEPTIVERVIRGNDCEFIKICDVTSNTGCSDGNYTFLIVGVSQHLIYLCRKQACPQKEDWTEKAVSPSEWQPSAWVCSKEEEVYQLQLLHRYHCSSRLQGWIHF